ncbi:MAG: hypothetical protein QNJ41_04390 [Xenococcaceae cyanobacterium MO_188.B32]|nr:hypothetical protein [Xenococcaceae cyanobacterium MO_188.B32]
MKLLLDTHVLIWFAQGSKKLSQTAEELIHNYQNELWLSMATHGSLIFSGVREIERSHKLGSRLDWSL